MGALGLNLAFVGRNIAANAPRAARACQRQKTIGRLALKDRWATAPPGSYARFQRMWRAGQNFVDAVANVIEQDYDRLSQTQKNDVLQSLKAFLSDTLLSLPEGQQRKYDEHNIKMVISKAKHRRHSHGRHQHRRHRHRRHDASTRSAALVLVPALACPHRSLSEL